MAFLGAQQTSATAAGPTLLSRRGVAEGKLALKLHPLRVEAEFGSSELEETKTELRPEPESNSEPEPAAEIRSDTKSEPESEAAVPNLSGVWVMNAVVGLAGRLEDTGLGWMTRQDYGKGRFTMSIEQAGDLFTVAEGMDGSPGSALTFRAGAGEQVASDPKRLRRVFVRAEWQREALCVKERTAGRDVFPAKYFRLQGEQLVLESATVSGDKVAVHYVRFAREQGLY